VIAGSLYAISRSRNQITSAAKNDDVAAHCEAGIGSSRAAHPAHPAEPGNAGDFDVSASQPPVIATTSAPAPAPEGMVWIPGGEFSMGAEDPEMRGLL